MVCITNRFACQLTSMSGQRLENGNPVWLSGKRKAETPFAVGHAMPDCRETGKEKAVRSGT